MNVLDRLFERVQSVLADGSVGRLVWVKAHVTLVAEADMLAIARTLAEMILRWFGEEIVRVERTGGSHTATWLFWFPDGEGALLVLHRGAEESGGIFLDILGNEGAMYLELPALPSGWRLSPWPEEQTQRANRLLRVGS